MAHYAFLDTENIVTEIIVGIDETELIKGLTPEIWYGNLRNQVCKRTSYNGNIRGTYAGVGFFYNEEEDIFIFAAGYIIYLVWIPPACVMLCLWDGVIFLRDLALSLRIC